MVSANRIAWYRCVGFGVLVAALVAPHAKGQDLSAGKETGIGLGLTVVHKIVQDHGGGVLIESTDPTGTVFKLAFPPTYPKAKLRALPNVPFECMRWCWLHSSVCCNYGWGVANVSSARACGGRHPPGGLQLHWQSRAFMRKPGNNALPPPPRAGQLDYVMPVRLEFFHHSIHCLPGFLFEIQAADGASIRWV